MKERETKKKSCRRRQIEKKEGPTLVSSRFFPSSRGMNPLQARPGSIRRSLVPSAIAIISREELEKARNHRSLT